MPKNKYKGNKNAVKHGIYAKNINDLMTDTEKLFYEDIKKKLTELAGNNVKNKIAIIRISIGLIKLARADLILLHNPSKATTLERYVNQTERNVRMWLENLFPSGIPHAEMKTDLTEIFKKLAMRTAKAIM